MSKRIIVKLISCSFFVLLFQLCFAFNNNLKAEEYKNPVTITDFENVIMRPSTNYNWDFQVRGGTGNVSINTDQNYVKSGNKSLRVDFDFTGTSGTVDINTFLKGTTVGTPVATKANSIPIPGYPTHLGIWIYGDKSNVEIRSWIRDNSEGTTGASYFLAYSTKVDWEGWKYVEAEVPQGLAAPLYLYMPVRAVSSAEYSRTKGTIYVDDIKAIYGYSNEDVNAPVIDSMLPAEGATVKLVESKIELTLSDDLSGINKQKTKLFIDNNEIVNGLIIENLDKKVKVIYDPNEYSPLTYGEHTIRLEASDNANNKLNKTWKFTISDTLVNITEQKSSKTFYYAGEKDHYKIMTSQYTNFTKYSFTAAYNKDAIKINKVTISDPNIRVVKNSAENGTIEIELENMKNYSMPSSGELIDIEYEVKNDFSGKVEFKILSSKVTEGLERITKLAGFTADIKYRYTLSSSDVVRGLNAELKFVENSVGILDADLVIVNENKEVLGKTNDKGILTTDVIGKYPNGSTVLVQGIKDGLYSNIVEIKVLTNNTPNKIIYTANETIKRGTELLLTGKVQNIVSEDLANEIVWSIKNPVNGISIVNNKLVVTKTVSVSTKVTVVATFGTINVEKEITVTANDIVDKIEITNPNTIVAGKELTLIADVKNTIDELIEKGISWQLKSNIEGVTIENNILKVGKSVKAGTKIIISSSVDNVSQEQEITVLKNSNNLLTTSSITVLSIVFVVGILSTLLYFKKKK